MENRSIKILCIDDNKDNLITLKALILETFPDAILFMALSGEEGIKLAYAEDPDVILLDIIMPVMSGYEVCKQLKADKKLNNIPVVFLTALKEDKDSRVLALYAGAEGFLSKPIDKSELTAQIRAMLKVKKANIEIFDEKERLAILVAERTKELKESEAKLKDYLNLLKNAGKLAKFGGWSVILSENRSYWSDEVASIHEMPAGHCPLVKDGINFYAPEWREKITQVFTDCAQKGIPYDEEMEIITSSGKRVWVRTNGEAVRDDIGIIYKVQGGFQDITERKESEVELKHYKENLENLVNERTKELEEKNAKLEKFNKIFVEREFRVKELRDRVKELEEKLNESGK